MVFKIVTVKNSKHIIKLLPLIVLLLYVLISSVSARKHNSYRRFYKKGASPNVRITTPRPDYYGTQNIYTTVSYPYGNYHQSPTWDTSYYNVNRRTKLKKSNRSKYQTDRHSPYGHELKAVEKDDTLDGLTGVIGPLIFPIPFLLAILPFAIPAIPIALSLPFGNSTDEEG